MCNKHEKVASKFNRIALNILTVLTTFALGLAAYWSLWDYDVVEYNTEKLVMQKDEYVVGEPLTYRLSVCKNGDLSATVIRNIRDTVVYSYPVIQSSLPEGCSDFISSSSLAPNVPTGTYVYENTVIYQVNPIRTVQYHIESTPFKIINPN